MCGTSCTICWAGPGSAARRAVERNDEALERWVKQRWPQLKKSARRQNALIVFEDESGVSLLPSVWATWGPRGHTPVLKHRFNWKRLSLAGALAYEPDGSDAHLVFQLRPGAYNDETLIEFLTEFLTEFNQLEQQRPVVLIWDGLPSHHSGRIGSAAPSVDARRLARHPRSAG